MAIDPLKIVVEVQNKKDLEALTQDAKNAESEIIRLNALFKQTGDVAYQKGMLAMGESLGNIRTKMQELGPAAGSAGRGLSQLSYAIDDMQYGFNAIVNNIPQIVMGLGGGAGIAGAVGIAAVAVNQLIKHWGDLTDAFKGAWSGDSVAGLKAIREATEEATEAFTKLLKVKTEAMQTQSAGIAKTITEGPLGRVEAALLVAMQGDQMQAKPDMGKRVGWQMGMPVPFTPEAAEAEAKAKDVGTIKALIGGAISGDEHALNDLMRLARKAPEGALPEGFIGNIQAATPAGQKAAKDQAEREKEAEGNRALADAQKVAREKVDRSIKERIEEKKHNKKEADDDATHWQKKLDDGDKKIAHQDRMNALKDQENMIQRQKHDMGEAEWQRLHDQPAKAQILQSAKAAIDLYQTAGTNEQKELAKKAHNLQEKANKELEKIREAIEKEQRGMILQH